MGHSSAGLYIRAYAARYPHNLSGLVFVDGSTLLQQDRFPNELREENKNLFMKIKWLEMLGIVRAIGYCRHYEGLDDFTGKMIKENQCRASQLTAVGKEDQSSTLHYAMSGIELSHVRTELRLLLPEAVSTKV
jgi:pimeloyl-ACP methyl ester carboxylesterase